MYSPGTNAQLDPERKAFSRLQDKKWDYTYRLLKKSLRKDSSNTEAIYVMSIWFLAAGNPSFQIDSASFYATKIQELFITLDAREKERLSKFPIDSALIVLLRTRIDSAAFERARQLNTEVTYQYFIDQYASAKQIPDAIELRDEVSYLEALRKNTYQSFKDFINKYPASHRYQDASERYERLLYEHETRTKNLEAFKAFAKSFPQSPFNKVAQKEVFEISTASGEIETLLQFLRENTQSPYRQFALDLLFHLLKEKEENFPEDLLTDSLKAVKNYDMFFWIPVLRNGLFGFIDQSGKEVRQPQYEKIEERYKCEPVLDDILKIGDGYYSRSGKKVAADSVNIKSIGYGFLQLEAPGCIQLMHKSGRLIISDCYEEYQILDGNFIAAIKNNECTIFTLAGRKLLISNVQKAQAFEGVIVLSRHSKRIINTISQLASMVNSDKFHQEFVFDEVTRVGDKLLKVRVSGLEGILSSNLEYVVPLENQTLQKTNFGLIEKSSRGTRVRGLNQEMDKQLWSNVRQYRQWLVLTSEGREYLYHVPTQKMLVGEADSIWQDRNLILVMKEAKQTAYLSPTRSFELSEGSRITFIPSRDSIQFFYTQNKKKYSVMSLAEGELIFNSELEPLQSIGTEFFIVTKASKKGILSRQGKVLVPVEMDEIVLEADGHASLLKNRKFGKFNLQSKRYIKPEYERNVVVLNSTYLVVFREGYYGIITESKKPVTDFEYSEVQTWNDSLIWVKKDYRWQILNIHTLKVIEKDVRDFTWLKNTNDERIVKIHQGNYYGILSNRSGLVIPTTFTEIINLGTLEEPLYFTEKYIEEAGIYIVVYYNQQGELLRKQAYEEEEYLRIVCDN